MRIINFIVKGKSVKGNADTNTKLKGLEVWKMPTLTTIWFGLIEWVGKKSIENTTGKETESGKENTMQYQKKNGELVLKRLNSGD